MSRRRGAGGFTLLEVLVAMALLAGALAALSDLAGSALRNHEAARDLNTAVLLARGRMAQIEERYEDSGFKDGDEEEGGDFSEEGRPDMRWGLQVVRPAPDLSADQLISMLVGVSGAADASDLAQKLLGGQLGAAAAKGSSGPGPTTAMTPALGAISGLVQSQLTAFGEVLKRSVREVRLTVSWAAGSQQRSFTITTHLVVLNPRAPGGARGDSPDVPASLVAATQAAAVQGAAAARLQGLAPGGFSGLQQLVTPAPKKVP